MINIEKFVNEAINLFEETCKMIKDDMWFKWKLVGYNFVVETNQAWFKLHKALNDEDGAEVENAFKQLGGLLDNAIAEANKNAEELGKSKREELKEEFLPKITGIIKRWQYLNKEVA